MVSIKNYAGITLDDNSQANFLSSMLSLYWKGTEEELNNYAQLTVEKALAYFETDVKVDPYRKKYFVSVKNYKQLSSEVREKGLENFLKSSIKQDPNTALLVIASTVFELQRQMDNGNLPKELDEHKEILEKRLYSFKNSKIDDTKIQTMSLNLTGLSDKDREDVVNTLMNYKSQALLNITTQTDNGIDLTYSVYGVNKFTGAFATMRNFTGVIPQTQDPASTKAKINFQTYDVLQTLAKKHPELVYSYLNKLGVSNDKVYGSNELLYTNVPEYTALVAEAQEIIDGISSAMAKTANLNRGSMSAGTNAKTVVQNATQKIANAQATIKKTIPKADESKSTQPEAADKKVVEVKVNNLISLVDSSKDEIIKKMADLELQEAQKRINGATAKAENIANSFVKYLENGKTIDEAKKILSQAHSNNNLAVEMGITLASKSLAEVKINNSKLSVDNEQLQTNNDILVDKVKDYGKQVVEITDRVKLERSQHSETVLALNGEISKISEHLETSTKQSVQMMNQIKDQDEQLSKQSTSLDNNEKDITILKSNVSKQKETILEQETTITNRDQTVSTLTKEKISLINSLSTAETDNIRTNKKLQVETDKVTNLNNKVRDLNKDLSSKNSQITSLDEDNTKLLGDTATLKEQISAKDKNIESIKNDARKIINDKNSQIKKLDEKLVYSKKGYETQIISKEKITGEKIKSLEDRIAELEAENQALLKKEEVKEVVVEKEAPQQTTTTSDTDIKNSEEELAKQGLKVNNKGIIEADMGVNFDDIIDNLSGNSVQKKSNSNKHKE